MQATIFRLPGTFSNPSLPIVAPLVQTGLVAAWRLYAGEESMHDLSGNGHTLTAVGSPQWTTSGVVCGIDNYFQTDVADMRDLTIVLTSRPILKSDGGSSRAPGAGTFKIASSQYRGVSLWHAGTTTTQNMAARTSGPNASGDIKLAGNTVGGNRARPTGSGPMEHAFAAVAYDSAANTTFGTAPRYGSNNDLNVDWDNTSPNLILAERDLNLPNGQPNTFVIGAEPGYYDANATQVEICEVLIFDRALSSSAIAQQYAYSKKFYLEVFGIEV